MGPVARKLATRFGWVLAGVLIVSLTGYVPHSWIVRDYVRGVIAARIARDANAIVSIDGLQYNLFALRFSGRDIAISPSMSSRGISLRAARVAVDLSWRALLGGAVGVEQLTISDLEVATPARPGGVEVSLNGLQVSLRNLSGESTAGTKAGRVHLGGTGVIRVGTSTIALKRLDAPFALEAGTLRLNGARVEADGLDITVNGRVIDALGSAANAALDGAWQLNAVEACRTWLEHSESCDRIRAGVLRGELSVQGPLPSPVARVTARSDGLMVGSVRVGIDGEGRLAEDSVEVPRLDVRTLGGRFLVDGTLSLSTAFPVLHGNVAWEAIDLRALLAACGADVAIDAVSAGRLVVSGDPRRPQAMKMVGDARATPGLGSGVAASGALAMRLAGGDWSMQLDAGQVGAMAIGGVASGQLGGDSVDALAGSSLQGTFLADSRDLVALNRDLAALGLLPARNAPLHGWQSGGTALVKLGGTIGRPEVVSHVELTTSPPDAPPVHLRADVDVDRVRARVQFLQATRGADRIDGAAELDRRTGAIRGEFTALVPDLAALDAVAGNAGTRARGAAVVKGELLGTAKLPEVRASVHATDVALAGISQSEAKDASISLGTLDAHLSATASQLHLNLDAPDRRISARGSVDLERGGHFDALVTLRDTVAEDVVRVLASTNGVTGVVAGEVAVRGPVDNVRDAEIDIELSRLEATARGARLALAGPAHLRVEALRVAEAQISLTLADLTARVTKTQVDKPLHVSVEGALPAELVAPLDAPTMSIEALVDENRIDVRRAFGSWGSTTAEATAVIPASFLRPWWRGRDAGDNSADGEHRAVVRVDARSISIAEIGRIVPAVAGYADGTFDLSLSIDAARPSLEAVRIDGKVERARIEAAGVQLTQDSTATIAMRDGAVSISALRWITAGGDLTLSAESTLGGNARRFEATATGEVDLARLRPSSEERVAGLVRLDLSARGDADGFAWNGNVDVNDGAWVAPQRRVAVTDLNAQIVCSTGRCHVAEGTGRLNGGTLAVTGDVPNPRVAAGEPLRAVLRGAGIELPAGTRHDIDADITLTAGDAPRVAGTVTLWPGTVTDSISALIAAVSTPETVAGMEPPPNAFATAMSRVALDVRIDSGTDLSFAAPDLEIGASANLRVRGTLSAPQILGEIAAIERGRVFLVGRSWDIETATISLVEGARGPDVRIAATATAMISRYTVEINVSGSPSRPTLVMRSDPPLGQSDLASLVITGNAGGDLSEAGSHQVASLVSSELLSGVGRVIGFDAVRVENTQSDLSVTDLEPVSRLTVTKRVTPQFDLIYSQGLSESDDLAWILVYKPGWRSLDLRATVRTNGSEAYEIRQELEFGKPQRVARVRRAARAAITVSQVGITGVEPQGVPALRERLSLAPGKPFSTGEWQHDRQAILEFFHEQERLSARVRASHTVAADGSYALKYDVAPGPITRVDVRGYRPRASLLESLRQIWSRVLIEDFLAERLTEAVRIDLAAAGHLAAEVTTAFTALPGGGKLAVIDVEPGARVRRRSIEFSGNKTVLSADLERLLDQQGVEPRCWVIPSIVETPITAYYHARGFWAVRVGAVRTMDQDRAALVVSVDEGPQFRVGMVSFSGTGALGEAAARSGFALSPGAPFSSAALLAATAGLRTAYTRAGYRDVSVDPHVARRADAALIDVAVAIAEGRRSVLQSVRIEGRDETGERLVTRVLAVEPGGVLDPNAFDAGQQRLYNTGIFRTVDVDIRPVAPAVTSGDVVKDAAIEANDQPVDAVVTLEERAKYRLRYGVQFGPSTIEDITTSRNDAQPGATIDLQRRNLYGQGITVGGGGVWSAEQHRIRGTVSAATLRGRFVSTTFTIENANQDRSPDNQVFLIDRSVGAVLEQRWKFGRVRRVELAYGFEVDHRRVEFQSPDHTLPLKARFAGLNTTVTYDTRDNQFNPRRGMFHTSRVESGAGLWLSDIAFGRYQVQQFAYFPVGPATLASGLRFGALDVDNERDPASIILFFKTGGSTTVRGYDTDSLTPGYVLGLPAGGKVLLVLNQEIRVPLKGRFGMVGFFDAGNTFTGLDTLSLSGLKVGAGVGVRFDTPFAVLRLDAGFPVPALPTGRRVRFHFSIGQAF